MKLVWQWANAMNLNSILHLAQDRSRGCRYSLYQIFFFLLLCAPYFANGWVELPPLINKIKSVHAIKSAYDSPIPPPFSRVALLRNNFEIEKKIAPFSKRCLRVFHQRPMFVAAATLASVSMHRRQRAPFYGLRAITPNSRLLFKDCLFRSIFLKFTDLQTFFKKRVYLTCQVNPVHPITYRA